MYRSLAISVFLVLPSICCGSSISVVWNSTISTDAYYYASFVGGDNSTDGFPTGMIVGTFGVIDCHANLLNISNGKVMASEKGVCQVTGGRNAYAALGYKDPHSNIIVNPSSSPLDHDYQVAIGGQYYPAYGNSLATTRAEIFVWGSRPGKIDISKAIACLYAISLSDGSMYGPITCLSDFGEGEMAQVLLTSDDGTLVLISAGLELVVLERPNVYSHNFTTRFTLKTKDLVFVNVGFSNDGSMIAILCEGGASICVLKYDADKRTYTQLWSAKTVDDLNPELLAFSEISDTSDSQPLLAVTYNDGQDGTHWAVASYDAISGKQLWLYKSKTSSGELTDFTSTMVVTNDGGFVIVGSFGDANNINPQVHVFKGWNAGSTPLINTFQTSGSVGAVLAAYAPGNKSELFIGVAALNHHENISFQSGTAWLLKVDV